MREATHELKEKLVYAEIVFRGRCEPGNGIVKHYADEEGQKYPTQRTDFPSGTHAASLGMPISCACVLLRRGFQHRGQ
jgi:hypothetical protein